MTITNDVLQKSKHTFSTLESCLMHFETQEEYDKYGLIITSLNASLAQINPVLIKTNQQMDQVVQVAGSVADLASPVENLAHELKKVEPVIETLGDAASEIEKVLKKEKWGLSAEDILKGASGVMDFMLGWAEDLVKPYLSKIVPDIPGIPDINPLQSNIDQIKEKYNSLEEEINKLKAIYDEYSNISYQISSQMAELKSPCFGEAYFIQSAQEYEKSNKAFWDIAGSKVIYEQGQKIQVWELSDNASDRKYYIEPIENGFVIITAALSPGTAYLDLSGNNSGNGTPMQLWDKNTSGAQKFKLKDMGDGRYKIFNANGKMLCLAGRSSDNGTALNLWDDHEGAFTEWVFISAKTNEKVILNLKLMH
jgi:archaellum component FlaC